MIEEQRERERDSVTIHLLSSRHVSDSTMIHIIHKCVFVCFLLIVNGDLRSVVKSFFDFHLTVNSSLRATSSENQQCGFRTDSTQTELYSHRSRLETGNFGFRK